MKKILAICALVMSCAVSIMAQKFYPVTKVEQVSDTRFKAYSGAQELWLNHILYREVVANPSDYLMVIYKGEKASAITLAKKSDIHFVVTEVMEVRDSVVKGKPKVYVRFNRKYSPDVDGYSTANREWLGVQSGQHVAYCRVLGETKIIACRPHTVGRDVALTTTVPISPAPTEPVLPLDYENRIIEPE